jgi:alkylation response protein AidB-like acyl-CoA dehydrogenase
MKPVVVRRDEEKMIQNNLEAAPLTVDDFAGVEPDQQLIDCAASLVPLIRQHAAPGSEPRFVAEPVIRALDDAGFFSLLVPRRLGGQAANLRTTMEVIAELGRGDGSTAWAAQIFNICGWVASTFGEQAQNEVFVDGEAPRVCGNFMPGGQSDRVDGGYRISGRWPYVSGSFAAQWATLGIMAEAPPGANSHAIVPAAHAIALVPASAWTIEPTWFVTGMEGSGSDTLVIEDHFVPDHRVQHLPLMLRGSYATPFQGSEQSSNITFISVGQLILVPAQLGLARHAIEVTLEKLPSKLVAYTTYLAKNSPAHHLRVAEAITKFDMAELLMQRAARDIDSAALEHTVVDELRRGRIRSDTGTIAELVTAGIDELLSVNGAGSFAKANVLSRIWRDSAIAARHAMVIPDVGRELYGRLLLGADGPLPGVV